MSSLTTDSPTTSNSDDNNNFMVIDKDEENEYVAKLKAYIYNHLFDSTIDPGGKLPILHGISKDFREKIKSALKPNEKYFKPELNLYFPTEYLFKSIAKYNCAALHSRPNNISTFV